MSAQLLRVIVGSSLALADADTSLALAADSLRGEDESAWGLIATILVMLTIPGVALFYGGMVRSKNVLNTMGWPLVALALASMVWIFIVPLVELAEEWSSPLWLYQTFCAALALALVAGSVVERIRFSFFLLFGLAWLVLVYAPIAQALWGGGWLARMGSLDFAGGAVIHISAGVTGLVAAIVIGPRKGYGRTEMMPHDLCLSMCGVGLLWVGWFGFAAGRGIASITTAGGAIVAIQIAAAAAALAWTVIEWIQRGKPMALGTITGAVAGLVAIAPAAGYVGPLAALVIGIGVGILCYLVVTFVKPILGYDDSLDVFGVHGVGGTWGMVATGLFASTQVNPDGSDGLFYAYPYQLFAQLFAVGAVWVWTGAITYLLVKALQVVLPARVDDAAETMGLDLAQHGEQGYSR